MSGATNISWTDKTWNPCVGCSKVSAGCANCYAEKMANRLAHMALADAMAEGKPSRKDFYPAVVDPKTGKWNGKVECIASALSDPLKWRKPARIFVNSMSDLFHPAVPVEFIDRVFAVMALCPRHTFQILTKRPERMAQYLNSGSKMKIGDSVSCDIAWQMGSIGFDLRLPEGYATEAGQVDCGNRWPLPNVWLGTSVENQQAADERIPHLLKCPATARFLSMEPLLGPVDLGLSDLDGGIVVDTQRGCCIHWVIVGGESGSKARPMHTDWVRSLRDQCKAAGVPFFFKQWGEWSYGCRYYDPDDSVRESHLDRPHTLFANNLRTIWQGDYTKPGFDGQPPVDTEIWHHVGKKAAGRLLDGVEWSQMPGEAFPATPSPGDPTRGADVVEERDTFDGEAGLKA